jgi:allantoinase
VEALWRGLAAGEIDCVASDHSPCPWELKAAGAEDIWAAWGGISGHQFTLPLLWSEGVRRGRLTPERLAAVTAGNAARIFGLSARKGAIRLGADADLVLLDPDREWTITPEEIRYRHGHTPYLGWRVTGRVLRTLVRGRTVYAEGGVDGAPGHGELLRPGGASPGERRVAGPGRA